MYNIVYYITIYIYNMQNDVGSSRFTAGYAYPTKKESRWKALTVPQNRKHLRRLSSSSLTVRLWGL